MILQLAAIALLSQAATADELPMPELELRYRRGVKLEWRLHPPAGEHIAEGSTVLLQVDLSDGQAWDATGPGEALTKGWRLPPLFDTPTTMLGTMSASLCTDDGSQCRPLVLAIEVALDAPRGKLRWTPAPGDPPIPAREGAPVLGFDDALAEAAMDGKPLLLDFSAQWCPPCQTLAAEVLHAAEHETTLAGLHLVVLDADDPSSWELKDRYAVGGYPTVIATDAQGRELARLTGYPGEQAFVSWLAGATERGHSLSARIQALQRAELDPPQAAVLALDLVRAGRSDEAREALSAADDSEPAMRAKLALDGDADALRWLVEHRMDDARSWIWDGLEALRHDPALAAELRPRLLETCQDAEPAMVTEITALLAELDPADQAPARYAAAAEAMAATLGDDPAHNRGRWSELAWLLEEAGDYDKALAVLDTAIHHYPQEFGYHNAKARVLQHLGRLDQAEVEARLALEHAYGDQQLRAVTQLAGILLEEGRPDLGLEAIDAVLGDFQIPDPDLAVRTHRYLDSLAALRSELEAAASGQ